MSICPPLPHPSPLTIVQHSKPLTGGYAKGFSQWTSERSVAQSHLNPSYCLSGNSPGVPGAMGHPLTPQREQLLPVWPPSPPLFCLVASSHMVKYRDQSIRPSSKNRPRLGDWPLSVYYRPQDCIVHLSTNPSMHFSRVSGQEAPYGERWSGLRITMLWQVELLSVRRYSGFFSFLLRTASPFGSEVG